MKNITLSVDEKVLAAVRRYAVEHESSVNGLVREYFDQDCGQRRPGAFGALPHQGVQQALTCAHRRHYLETG